MAIVRPFKAIRPTPQLAQKVAALPYDVMSSEEAKEMVRGNPYSFLYVDKSEIGLEPGIDPYDQKVYKKARENLDQMIEQNIYIQDEHPLLYIYRLTMDERVQTGIVGCTSIDDYINNHIRKHELTREDKEQDRINHVDYCNANTGPIFLTYRSKVEINQIVDKWMECHGSVYDFIAEDGIRHEVWRIDDKEVIQGLRLLFETVPNLYIADGHHRAASAVKVGLKRREEYPNYTGEEEFNFFLSVIFPDDQLQIMDYNRVVKDLNGLSDHDFLEKLKENFEVKEIKGINQPYGPSKKYTFGMYLDKKWYSLKAKEEIVREEDPVENLDVTILQKKILAPILGIENPRTSTRIEFVGGIRGLIELEKRVQKDMKVAFSMYPTTIQELMNIADKNKIMPPKSTWFEPKLRSGLFVHKLS